MTTTDRICGCHVVTGAGIVASLQLIMLAICMSSSGIILDRYWDWTSYERAGYIASGVNEEKVAEQQAKSNKTLRENSNRWSVAWVELGMAWYTAYASFWLFSLLILALSFKYYRPVFVVPNFTALVVGLFMNLFAFAVLLAYELGPSKVYQVTQYNQSLIAYVLGLFLFEFLMTIFFLVFISKYHNYLRVRYGHQVPKFVASRGPRTGYQDEMN